MKPLKKNFAFYLPIVLLLLCLLEPGLIAQRTRSRNILHLKIDDFISFFKHNPYWMNKSKSTNRNYHLWRFPFVCWKRNTREILSPNPRPLPTGLKKLPENLAVELENYYKGIAKTKHKKNSCSLSYLITRDEMIMISIRNLLVNNLYSSIQAVKGACSISEENIAFYILDFCVPQTIAVSYVFQDKKGGWQLRHEAPPIVDPTHVGEWQKLVENYVKEYIHQGDIVVKNPDTQIKIQLKGLIGRKTIRDSFNSVTSACIKVKGKSMDYYKSFRKVGTKVPAVHLNFNLNNENDFEILKTPGLWIEENRRSTRISYDSIYGHMRECFDKSGATFRDKTFTLHYARTTNFENNKFRLNHKAHKSIKNRQLPAIWKFTRGILAQRKTTKRKTYIQVIGYADKEGKEKNNWQTSNYRYSLARAQEVHRWLREKIKQEGFSIRQVEVMKPRCCPKDLFNKNDRCVEFKIY